MDDECGVVEVTNTNTTYIVEEVSPTETVVEIITQTCEINDTVVQATVIERDTEVVEVNDVGRPGATGPPGPGTVLYLLAGENINALHVVIILPDDYAYLADSSIPDDSERTVGVALTSALTGEPISVMTTGDIQGIHGFSIGPLFLGAAGALVPNPSTGLFQYRIGEAVSSTRIIVRPEVQIHHN